MKTKSEDKDVNSEASRRPDISSEVKRAITGFKGKITASQLIARVITYNETYLGGALLKLDLVETTIQKEPAEWLEEIISLFNFNYEPDLKLGSQLEDADKTFELDGRLVIIGLCLLEKDLKRQIEQYQLFQPLLDELQKPLVQLLSSKGAMLYDPTSENVHNQPDEPLESIEQDLLGRSAFARFLAMTINNIKIKEGAYSIHLCGAWGSGKSTVLNFLQQELGSAWVSVKFNAWQNQHITPPWWPLYTRVFSGTKLHLNRLFRFKELLWRLLTGQPVYLLATIIAFWVIVIIFSILDEGSNITTWGNKAKDVAAIIALLTTVVGIIIGFSRSLLFGSAKAAESFQQYAHDPMEKIHRRFERLVKSLSSNGKRLIVFIDDLDRCNINYVVGLLEGIQTLFRQGSAVFIVAADRKWLYTCFEQVYKDFSNTVGEPGKPLGVLFLEKSFQLCTPVPGIPNEFKNDYWKKLIEVENKNIKMAVEEARNDVRNQFSKNPSDGEIKEILQRSKEKVIYEQIAIREEALVLLASSEVRKRTEHTLIRFLPLTDDNPRSLIRLVNMYCVNKARAIMSFLDIDTDDLIQWTILSMRWPQLAEYLVDNPDSISKIGARNIEGIDPKVAQLFNDDSVLKVINGIGITDPIDKKTLKLCASLG